MKNILPDCRKFLASALLCGIALAFCASTSLAADEATNSMSGSVSKTMPAATNQSRGSEANSLGLPKETLDRLSPDQILELAREHELFGGSSGPTNPETAISIMVPLGLFAMVVALVSIGVIQKNKRNAVRHETIRLMVEKGQPLPPELLQPEQSLIRPRNDLRRGLVLIAVGIGLFVCLGIEKGVPSPIKAVGIIPFLMGVAILISWKIESKKDNQPR